MGFMGQVIARGDVIELEAVAGEDAGSAGGGIAREESGVDAAGGKRGEYLGGPIVKQALLGSGNFVTMQDFLGGTPFTGGEPGNMFQEPAAFRGADLAADGIEIDQFLSQRAIHIKDDQLVWGRMPRGG